MINRSSTDLKRKKLFKPDVIAEKLSEGLNRDLGRMLPSTLPDHIKNYVQTSQRDSTLKKYLRDEGSTSLETETFIKFLNVNDHMSKFNQKIEPAYHRVSKLHGDTFSNVLHRAKALMHHVLTPFCEDDWFRECKNSSGSSIGVPFTDTSLERKQKFPISITERVKPIYDRYMTYDSHLRSATYVHNERYPYTDMYHIVKGSRATTVPKSNKINRMICVEPTGNMFLQQGLMQLMYQRMKSIGLDVQSLPARHTTLAFESSITSQNATIDWSSASDCMSRELLRWLLPPAWFYAVDICRSPVTEITGTWIELQMFSTMGNAVTFPLETLIFWTFSQAVLAEGSASLSVFPILENFEKTSVFGDDCVVPSKSAPLFIELMERVGFIVNTDKTFTGDGGFRESCGGDYLHGMDVRPFFLKAPTSAKMSSMEPWLYIIFNSLKTKYISYFGELKYMYESHVFSYLMSLFRKYRIHVKIVPDYYPDDSGLKITDDILRWRRAYTFTLSKIVRNRHGQVEFKFLRYTYKNKVKTVDELRYAVWLKTPIMQKRDPEPFYRPKIGGCYVVATASSSCWTPCPA